MALNPESVLSSLLSDAFGRHSAFLSLSSINGMMDLNMSGSKLLTFQCNKWRRQYPPNRAEQQQKKTQPFVPRLSERAQRPLSHWRDKESVKWSYGRGDIFQMR